MHDHPYVKGGGARPQGGVGAPHSRGKNFTQAHTLSLKFRFVSPANRWTLVAACIALFFSLPTSTS